VHWVKLRFGIEPRLILAVACYIQVLLAFLLLAVQLYLQLALELRSTLVSI
jgi:hypothetical protein